MKACAIILAAGKGTRYKGEKQNVVFHGKPLWQHVYDTVNRVDEISSIVIVGRDVPGGFTRTESVYNGLSALPADTDRVIILEAARPMVTKAQIMQLLNCPHPSVSFVRPLVNTVVYRNGTYINREELYDLLTPQAFDCPLLLQAYASGRFKNMTDETRAMYEYHGIKPFFIETDANLFKVTYPGDLDVIETIYQSLKDQGALL